MIFLTTQPAEWNGTVIGLFIGLCLICLFFLNQIMKAKQAYEELEEDKKKGRFMLDEHEEKIAN